MPEPIRITGIPQVIPNGATEDIRFVLKTKAGDPIYCVADYETASRVASGLGTALHVLRSDLSAKGSVGAITAESLSSIHVERTLLGDDLLIMMTTALGIPFSFQLPTQVALELSDLLKSKATKTVIMGTA